MKTIVFLSLLLLHLAASDFIEPNCGGKQVIVHLFEWSWESIALECENYLGPKGFCGVQVSPPMEHIQNSEWWSRYQPVSYKLESRSGTRIQFAGMVERCNAAGVNVIVDVVANHMTGTERSGVGTGGSPYDGAAQNYPGVPYSNLDFHQPFCSITNYQDPVNVRNCALGTLNDLDGSKDYVRDKVAGYMNDLISLGVKGFRMDASKHMWPGDIEAIQSRLTDQNIFFVHEVIDYGTEAVHGYEYFHLGKVTEFRACRWVACIRNGDFNCLANFGQGLNDGLHALVFVDNHDNQRNHGGGGDVLTHKEDYNYKLAVGFLLAQEYGFKRVMSSYYFENSDQGPPAVQPDPETCGNGWVCEHRWSTIGNMVQFANAVAGLVESNFQIKDGSLGFSRGEVGFFAMGDLNNVQFFTGLPDGDYCDIIHECAQTITIIEGWGTFNKVQPEDPVVAICVGCF